MLKKNRTYNNSFHVIKVGKQRKRKRRWKKRKGEMKRETSRSRSLEASVVWKYAGWRTERDDEVLNATEAASKDETVVNT